MVAQHNFRGMASTLCMRTAISPGQWQPWRAVSSLLGLIGMAQPQAESRTKFSGSCALCLGLCHVDEP